MSKECWAQKSPRAVWSPQLLALLVTSRPWNSRIQCWKVKLSQLRRPGIATLVNEPPKRFLETDKKLIVINSDIFEHLAPQTTSPSWLYEEMARANTLICGCQTVVDNMYEILDTETERRLNDDLHAPRTRQPVASFHLQLASQSQASGGSYVVQRSLVADFVTG